MSKINGNIFITAHDDNLKAVIHSSDPINWVAYDAEGKILVGKVFSNNQFPSQMSTKADIDQHNERVASNDGSINLKNGVSSHFCQFAPGASFPIHRTVSLDYGVCHFPSYSFFFFFPLIHKDIDIYIYIY